MKKTVIFSAVLLALIGGAFVAEAQISTVEYVAEVATPERLFFTDKDVSGKKEEVVIVDPRDKYKYVCIERAGTVMCTKK